MLSLKQLTPVRLIRNGFYELVRQAEQNGASTDELKNLLGKGRARLGMFEGDLENGELEIGQASALIKSIEPASVILEKLWSEFQAALMNPIK